MWQKINSTKFSGMETFPNYSVSSFLKFNSIQTLVDSINGLDGQTISGQYSHTEFISLKTVQVLTLKQFTLMHCCKSFSIYLSTLYLSSMKILQLLIDPWIGDILQSCLDHLYFYLSTTCLRHIESYQNNKFHLTRHLTKELSVHLNFSQMRSPFSLSATTPSLKLEIYLF